MTSIALPNTLTSIGGAAFKGNALTSVVIPDSITSIFYSTFANNALTSVALPSGLTTLSANSFANNNLTIIELPDTLTTIWFNAFKDNALTQVVIPASVTNIGNGAFMNNPDLVSAFFKPTNVPMIYSGPFCVFENTSPSLMVFHPEGATGYAAGWDTCDYDFVESDFTAATGKVLAAVFFDTNGGSSIIPHVVNMNASVTKPADPTLTGFVLDDWLLLPAGATYDFSAPVTEIITLQAKWKQPGNQGGNAGNKQGSGNKALANTGSNVQLGLPLFGAFALAALGGVVAGANRFRLTRHTGR